MENEFLDRNFARLGNAAVNFSMEIHFLCIFFRNKYYLKLGEIHELETHFCILNYKC